jgi:hypothetical protein
VGKRTKAIKRAQGARDVGWFWVRPDEMIVSRWVAWFIVRFVRFGSFEFFTS